GDGPRMRARRRGALGARLARLDDLHAAARRLRAGLLRAGAPYAAPRLCGARQRAPDGSRSPVSYKDLREFIAQLEARGELKRVRAEVSPRLEMTEICDRGLRAQGPALL